MTKQEKIIGILGGMRPAATLALYERILAFTPAECDQDHLSAFRYLHRREKGAMLYLVLTNSPI